MRAVHKICILLSVALALLTSATFYFIVNKSGDVTINASSPPESIITLSVSGPNTSLSSDDIDPLLASVCERFNVRFEFMPTGAYNASELYRLQAALNSMPDMLIYDARWELNYFIQSGALRPLPSNMHLYPNLSTYLAWPYARSLLHEGEIWGIPSLLFESNTGMINTCAVFYNDIYDAAWPYEAEPATLQDWQKLLLRIKKLYDEQIPLTSRNPESMYDLTYFYSPATYTWIWDADEARFLPGYYTDMFLSSINALRPLWQSELLDPDFMNEGSGRPSGLDKFMLGQASGIMYSCSPYIWQSEFVPAWLKTHPDMSLEDNLKLVFLPGNADGEYREAYSFHMDAIYFGANVNDKKMERMLSMLEWLCSEDGRNLRRYGIEGEDYRILDGGTIEMISDASELYVKYPSYAFLRTLPDHDSAVLWQTELKNTNIGFVVEQYEEWRSSVGIKTQFGTSIIANTVSTPAVINFDPNILNNSFRMLTATDICAEFDRICQEYRKNGIELVITSINCAL